MIESLRSVGTEDDTASAANVANTGSSLFRRQRSTPPPLAFSNTASNDGDDYVVHGVREPPSMRRKNLLPPPMGHVDASGGVQATTTTTTTAPVVSFADETNGEQSQSSTGEEAQEHQNRQQQDERPPPSMASPTPFLCFPTQPPLESSTLHPYYSDGNSFLQSKDDDEIPTKIPANVPSWYTRFASTPFVRSGAIYLVIVAITAAAMVYGVSTKVLSALESRRNNNRNNYYLNAQDLQVAFIGNAYFFVNDVPRLLEAVSEGHIYQNSCLHAGGTLSDILLTGNGMYTLWQTEEAKIEYTPSTTSSSSSSPYGTTDDIYSTNSEVAVTYDYGLCTVAQVLQGYDEYMSYGNKYGKYYSDGLNPCIMDTSYTSFVESELKRDPVSWDYVILVEQTKRMAVAEALSETLSVLTYKYAPLLTTSGAIPVVVDTHAFWSEKSNMTGLTDIPTFTYYITQGVESFTAALAAGLPTSQTPLVAPIGIAYLTVWEENYDLWEKLFVDDGIHSSLAGSYMFAVVLYATMFRRLPELPDNNNNANGGGGIASLFMDARKIIGQASYPSMEEAYYLRQVAGRVVLDSYIPQSMIDAAAVADSGQ